MARWWVEGRLLRAGAACVAGSAMLLMAGCNGSFFVCEGKSSCPTSPTNPTNPTNPTSGGDYAYVANSSAGSTYLSEYEIGSGKLNSVATVNLGFIPVALAVAPSNSFVYAASTPGFASPGIYLYSVGSTGALTVAHGGSPVATDQVAAMAVSPDGNWLYTVNVDGLTMAEYLVNTSTGALTLEGELTLPGTTCSLSTALPVSQACSVTVSPSEEFVATSLGPSGDYVFPYSSATNAGASQVGALSVTSFSTTNPVGNFSTAMDANNYLYVAQTNSITTYLAQSGSLTPETTIGFAAGSLPRSILLSPNYDYLYTADEGTGNISAFGVSGNAVLTQVSGSPFAGPADASSIAIDNTGDYLIAVGYDGSAGVRLYSISSSTGALTQVDATGSGTSTLYPALVAVTH